MDLFGLGQPESDPSLAQTVPPPARGSQKLWASLLVVDSIFVIVSGGAVAANLSKYWGTASPAAPVPAAVPAGHHAKPAPEPAKAEPAKPSSSSSSVKSENAAAAKAQALPAPSPASETSGTGPVVSIRRGKGKARKVVFSLRAPGARSVKLVGAFIMHGGRASMNKRGELWSATLFLNPGRYRYFFSVDGAKTLDPGVSSTERGASLMNIP